MELKGLFRSQISKARLALKRRHLLIWHNSLADCFHNLLFCVLHLGVRLHFLHHKELTAAHETNPIVVVLHVGVSVVLAHKLGAANFTVVGLGGLVLEVHGHVLDQVDATADLLLADVARVRRFVNSHVRV